MAEQNKEQTGLSVSQQVKSMISNDKVKKKFADVLGQKAPQFLASITNVVSGSAQLKKCDANSIMVALSASMIVIAFIPPVILCTTQSAISPVTGLASIGVKSSPIKRIRFLNRRET